MCSKQMCNLSIHFITHGACPQFFFKPISHCQTVTSNSANVLWVYVSSTAALRFFFPKKMHKKAFTRFTMIGPNLRAIDI